MLKDTVMRAALLAALACPLPVFAFGTVKAPLISHVGDCEGPQNAEHERITRRAFDCAAGDAAACFESRSLDQVAGKSGSFGAVGAPDVTTSIGRWYKPEAHCDGGDYVAEIEGYEALHGREAAKDAITACRAWMASHLSEAVADAAALLDDNGDIKSRSVRLRPSCNFTIGGKGRAKCNVLEDLGYALHAAQDFYAHSNWTDSPDAGAPISIENPPGLANAGAAPFLDLGAEAPPFPDGLMSGCYGDCEGRVAHAALNKDCGTIDPAIADPLTPRGKIAGADGATNFERAVNAAVEDSRRLWSTFQSKLDAAYGADKAARMTCALMKDDPTEHCD